MLKRAGIIGTALLLAVICIYCVLGSGNGISVLKEGIRLSIEEDFKIKESLGKVFFAKRDDDAVTASGSVTVASGESEYTMPVAGEVSFSESYGEPQMIIECRLYSHVCAVWDGVIEKCDENKLVLRLNDGIKAVYTGVVPMCKCGESVTAGDTIAYSGASVGIKLYKSCAAIDAAGYFR